MYTLSSSFDYQNSYKSELMQLLKQKFRSEVSGSQDFKDIFEKLDVVEQLVLEINKDFVKINEKYKLLFGLRDFERLFKEKDFKDEILLYIKFKALEK
jgi:hypothetical protein